MALLLVALEAAVTHLLERVVFPMFVILSELERHEKSTIWVVIVAAGAAGSYEYATCPVFVVSTEL